MKKLKSYRRGMHRLTCHSRQSKILYRGGVNVIQMDCSKQQFPIKSQKTLRDFVIPTFISIFAP